MDEVLERALVRKPEPIEWDEEAAKLADAAASRDKRGRGRGLRPDRALSGVACEECEAAPQGAVLACLPCGGFARYWTRTGG